MIKFLLWIWQLPQNCIGWLYSKCAVYTDCYDGIFVYYAPCFRAGVSLGEYIILDPVYFNALNEVIITENYFMKTVKHEYGHTKQSKYLGWFYLILVGIPSVIRNIRYRINIHKEPGKISDLYNWYYSGYPEKWADKLGNVKR